MSDINNQSTSTSVSVQNGITYVDQMITLRIFKIIEGLMNNLNLKSVILLIGLLGAESFKKIIKSFIEDHLFKKLKDINIFSIYYKIINLFKKQQKCITTKPVNEMSLKYSPKTVFWEGLDKISEENIISYNIVSSKIEQISKIEYTLYQTVNNFQIKTKEFKCSFINDIILKYRCTGNTKKIENCNNLEIVFDKTKTLFENLPFPDFVEDIKKYALYKTDTSRFGFNNIITPLKQIYKIKDYNDKICQELACILLAGRDNISIFRLDKKYNIFGVDLDEYSCIDTRGSTYSWGTISDSYKVKQWVDNQINKENINNQYSLCLKSDNLKLNLLDSWTKFVNDLQKDINQNTKMDNIKIYDIKINITEETENLLNPEYSENENENEKNNKIEKYLKKIKINKEIKETLINEIYKDFSTLYLKKQDAFFLNNTLERFKNKKDIYKNLGLPYKFGALLYGKPGTGKSSCINAISSYLKKDIYYLDLTTVKTNDDLKLLFNYINKEKSENGIIVIEDIDAMTNVVHDRNFLDLGSDTGELTLECLLNLLQGTLTHDGSTFLITTNHIEKLDPAFYRDGRFDIKMELTPCDHHQMNTIYNKFFGRNIQQELIEKLPEIKITPATFIQELLPYILKPDTNDSEILKKLIN